MKGTMTDDAFAMLLIPPKITNPVAIHITRPEIHVGIPKVELIASATELD